jgi:hypothetical protein
MSAFGASLVDDASASAARATLGLGTAAVSDTTAFDAAGAAAAVNSTLSTHVALATAHGISSFGATLVDDTDAATARGTLGLGSAATKTAPASGNAASGEVVLGNDTRLTDSRTPTSHNHAASEITSGTIATERLGSGTASSSTYLRGDQTWETISGGGASALDDLSDVAITSAVSGNFLRHNGTQFVNTTIQAGDIPSGVDATKIGGGTVSNTEFGYLDGVTSAIQTQLDSKASTSSAPLIVCVSPSSDITLAGNSSTYTTQSDFNATVSTTGKYQGELLTVMRMTGTAISTAVRLKLASGTISAADADPVGTALAQGASGAANMVYTSSTGVISGNSKSSGDNYVIFLMKFAVDVTSSAGFEVQFSIAGTTSGQKILKTSYLKFTKL